MSLESYRPTRIVIDLSSIEHNVRMLRSVLSPKTDFMAVVKADAYGHGLVQVSRSALKAGAAMLGVAIAEEGIALREAGVQAPILVLGHTMDAGLEAVVAHELIQTVFMPQTVIALDHAAKSLGKTAQVHIKLDTGMNRIGVRDPGLLDQLFQTLQSCPHVNCIGIFSHLASADEASESKQMGTQGQIDRFIEWTSHLTSMKRHLANSAGTLDWPQAHFDMVRCGIALYGVQPSKEIKRRLDLRPAMRWETRVVCIKDVFSGEGISYNWTFRASRDMRAAVLPVGYGDGYHRAASNRGWVLIRGQRAPIVGNICMDQMMVDVTDIAGVQRGDEAVLLGSQGEACIEAQQISDWTGTIPYEVVLAALPRVPRCYIGNE